MELVEREPSFCSSQLVDLENALCWRSHRIVVRAAGAIATAAAGAGAVAAPVLGVRTRSRIAIAIQIRDAIDLATSQRVDGSRARDNVGDSLAIGSDKRAERLLIGIVAYSFEKRIQTSEESCAKRQRIMTSS